MKKVFLLVMILGLYFTVVVLAQHPEHDKQHEHQKHIENKEHAHESGEHKQHEEHGEHFEQKCGQSMHNQLPGLTDAQKEKLKGYHLEFAKTAKPLEGKLKELQVQYQNLATADKVDMKAVNLKIETIGEIKTELLKKHEVIRQKIRKVLTEEQRLIFDKHSCMVSDHSEHAMHMHH